MKESLINYIRSTFNYKLDIDAYKYNDSTKLSLLKYKTYNIYFKPIVTPIFKDFQNEYEKMTMNAFYTWSDAIYGNILFKQVYKEHEADIKVFFLAAGRNKLGKQYQEKIITGCCNGFISSVKGKLCIAIGIRNYKNDKINYDKVYHVLLHEIGHVMCLGHSSYKSDIMSRTAQEYPTELSDRDIFVLRLIYTIGDGKSYKESKKYVEECVSEFVKYKTSQTMLLKQEPIIQANTIATLSENRNLLEELDSIGDLKKYKMIIENININNN